MINIAIDGTAGSGKSTVAKLLASKMNFKLLNTGEIYRSLACAYHEEFDCEPTIQNIEKFLKNKIIEIKFVDFNQFVFVNGVCYKEKLRTEEISILTSKISVFQSLRNKVLSIQRDFAKENNCIMEGRDIGTIVLPNANIKFFITASQEERARRRFLQVKDCETTYEMVLEDLKERDYRDINREVAPLKPAPDSIIIDNTSMTIDENVEMCLKIINEIKVR